jgi:putative membrane protein
MTRTLLIAGAAICALTLGACSKAPETKGAATPNEQAATPDANPAATVPTPANESTAPVFVEKAGQSDMFEIEAAKIAETRATNPQVKAFAKEMITAHTASSAALGKAITESGQALTPPAALNDDMAGKIKDLNKADAKDFDKTYVDGQVDAHQSALNLLQRYAEDGDVPAIKAFAAATAPKVQKHLDMAKTLKDGVK